MTVAFKMRTMRLWQDVKLGPSMLAKGKLRLIPESVKHKKEISKIFRETSNDK